jgi:hypothetical protein
MRRVGRPADPSVTPWHGPSWQEAGLYQEELMPHTDLFTGLQMWWEEPYDGVAELWWESEAAIASAMSTPEGQRAGAELLADEAEFIDLPSSPLWLAHEYPQVNPSPEHVVARPKSSIVKLHFPLRHPAGMSLDEASGQPAAAPAITRKSSTIFQAWRQQKSTTWARAAAVIGMFERSEVMDPR